MTGADVLIVDDEFLVACSIADQLQEAGYTVEMVPSGEAALAALESSDAFRLMITDVQMSGMNGWILATLARRYIPDLPVLYVTGDSSDQWQMNGVSGSLLLTKPVDPVKLTAAIQKLLV